MGIRTFIKLYLLDLGIRTFRIVPFGSEGSGPLKLYLLDLGIRTFRIVPFGSEGSGPLKLYLLDLGIRTFRIVPFGSEGSGPLKLYLLDLGIRTFRIVPFGSEGSGPLELYLLDLGIRTFRIVPFGSEGSGPLKLYLLDLGIRTFRIVPFGSEGSGPLKLYLLDLTSFSKSKFLTHLWLKVDIVCLFVYFLRGCGAPDLHASWLSLGLTMIKGNEASIEDWTNSRPSSVASPICQVGQSERNFPIFAFSSWFSSFSPIFPDFFQIFPDLSLFFSRFVANFFAVRGGTLPLATPVATPLSRPCLYQNWLSSLWPRSGPPSTLAFIRLAQGVVGTIWLDLGALNQG